MAGFEVTTEAGKRCQRNSAFPHRESGIKQTRQLAREDAMKFFASQRFLSIYSGVLTVVFAITVIGGFAAPRSNFSAGRRAKSATAASVDEIKFRR
jgi:hypothetical protein